MKSIDELAGNPGFTTAKTGRERSVTFLPEPKRAERRYTVISVDDHIVEPLDTFRGRVAQKFADRAPKVVDAENGGQTWIYDGQALPMWVSTRRSGDRCPSTDSSRHDSTKCGRVRGISTNESETWISMGYTPRLTSHPFCQGSRDSDYSR